MARKRAMKWNDLHLRPRVEAITEDNVESNCSMIKYIPPKGVSFSDLMCIFANVYRRILLFVFATLRYVNSSTWQHHRQLFVVQVLKKFDL